MGNCCVAAATATAHSNAITDAATDASAVSRKAAAAAMASYSPSWSFRWDNRTHTEEGDEEEVEEAGTAGSGQISGRNYNSSSINTRLSVTTNKSVEIEAVSDGGSSPFSYMQPPTHHKSPSLGRADSTVAAGAETDLSFGSNSSIEVDTLSSSKRSTFLKAKSFSLTPSPPTIKADPSSSRSCFLPSELTASRKTRRSPGYQLSRQVSDSHIPVLKSLDENSPDEGRQLFPLPSYGSDTSPAESHRGSSDGGWSMRLFTELVASCRNRPSPYANDNFAFGTTSGINDQQPAFPPAADLQTCAICYKLLRERPPWISHRIMNNEVPVVAVLVCGHVYHADCLENVTSEVDQYDPCCPVCSDGWKPVARMSKKTDFKSKSSKISRIAVADIDLDVSTGVDHPKDSGRKAPRMGTSSSLKGSISRPFLMRNFTVGSKTSQLIPESEITQKKGFWARRWKD